MNTGIEQQIRIQDYSYSLPEEKIAVHPLPERDASKLLVYRNGAISEDRYKNIARYLPGNSIVVFNNTRVVNARILFQKATGGTIEIFCLEPSGMEMSRAMQAQQTMDIHCFIGGASKWKHGARLEKTLTINDQPVLLEAVIKERTETHFTVTLSWNPPEIHFAAILHAAGNVPLPPYIKRPVIGEDEERYQTVYALYEGSVAAPTAGLHFTPHVLAELEQKNIRSLFVTLHVGAGTFQPVKTELANDHPMHGEWVHLPKTAIETLLHNPNNKVTAVGTTSLRTLETLYWCGVKLLSGNKNPAMLDQWEVYQLRQDVPLSASLERILSWMEQHEETQFSAFTKLMIVPGYRLRVANMLVTNFHQPQSTLLLLVAAVAGKNWKDIYAYALEHDFRFLSYGDGCLIVP